MNKVRILLNNMDKIRAFINVADTLSCDIKLNSGDRAVDGRSLLGIFTLDLANAVDVYIPNDRQDAAESLKKLEAFMMR
jgi:phosphotransferase system HPr-like phosphotransfer protein